MTHRNAPLTPEGRRRLIERCRTRPVAHVAAEMGISRTTASKWVNRYRRYGDLGLLDRSSVPHRQPNATPGRLVDRIERMRRERKWSASRIAFELEQEGTPVSRRTITRLLAQDVSVGVSPPTAAEITITADGPFGLVAPSTPLPTVRRDVAGMRRREPHVA
jgi:transposase-like protein